MTLADLATGYVGLSRQIQREKSPVHGRVLALTIDRSHLDQNGTAAHGVLTMFADDVLGRAVGQATRPRHSTTVTLACEFLQPVHAGEHIIGVAQVTRVTRSLVFVSGVLRVGVRDVLAAHGVWKLLDAA
ncbi:MAG: PaaI family thioesterase [Steroidobacteraceae bacterium]